VKCPDDTTNILRIIGLLLLCLIAIVVAVRSTIHEGSLKSQMKSSLSVFLRILMSHLQLLALTASFNLDWPANLQ